MFTRGVYRSRQRRRWSTGSAQTTRQPWCSSARAAPRLATASHRYVVCAAIGPTTAASVAAAIGILLANVATARQPSAVGDAEALARRATADSLAAASVPSPSLPERSAPTP